MPKYNRFDEIIYFTSPVLIQIQPQIETLAISVALGEQ